MTIPPASERRIAPVSIRRSRPCDYCVFRCDCIPFCTLESKRVFEKSVETTCDYHFVRTEMREFIDEHNQQEQQP